MSSNVLELAKKLVRELEKEEDSKIQLSEIPEEGRFKTGIGNFIVLEQREDSTVVITEDLYKKNVKFDDDCAEYRKSELRELCEGRIYKDFSREFEVDNILENAADLITVDVQEVFGKLLTKVRPMTFDEVRKYNDLLPNKELEDWYWTCTPWSTKERGWEYSVAVVSPSGSISRNYCNSSRGVRPFCILKSNIFVSKVEEE